MLANVISFEDGGGCEITVSFTNSVVAGSTER